MKEIKLHATLVFISGFLAVALGAFGAHGLKPYLDSYQQGIYDKAVHYQFFHSLAAFASVIYYLHTKNKYIIRAIAFFLLGILFFSGSLYLLATAQFHFIPKIILGPITPIGGLCFLTGWVLLIFSVYKED